MKHLKLVKTNFNKASMVWKAAKQLKSQENQEGQKQKARTNTVNMNNKTVKNKDKIIKVEKGRLGHLVSWH